MNAMLPSLVNFAAYQATWFASVLGAAAGVPWLGPAVVALWMGGHLPALGGERGVEWRMLLIAAALGYAVDSLLVLGGWISFPGESWAWGSPPWMVTLWIGFAATLSRSLRWLNGRYGVAAVLGLAGGPAAYYAGARLGAVELPPGFDSELRIGLAWATALPVLLRIRAALARPPVHAAGAAAGPPDPARPTGRRRAGGEVRHERR